MIYFDIVFRVVIFRWVSAVLDMFLQDKNTILSRRAYISNVCQDQVGKCFRWYFGHARSVIVEIWITNLGPVWHLIRPNGANAGGGGLLAYRAANPTVIQGFVKSANIQIERWLTFQSLDRAMHINCRSAFIDHIKIIHQI